MAKTSIQMGEFLRSQIEGILEPDETLAEFIRAACRRLVKQRKKDLIESDLIDAYVKLKENDTANETRLQKRQQKVYTPLRAVKPASLAR